MPFDGSSFIVVDDLAILRTARRNIAKPSKWAKGDPDTWADDANCIVGWIAFIIVQRGFDGEPGHLEADRLVREYIVPELHDTRNKNHSYQVRLLRFNDRPSTTQAEVVALFDRAIARARGRRPRR
jgi:hypothetical protein